jgi:hypothetical protein
MIVLLLYLQQLTKNQLYEGKIHPLGKIGAAP